MPARGSSQGARSVCHTLGANVPPPRSGWALSVADALGRRLGSWRFGWGSSRVSAGARSGAAKGRSPGSAAATDMSSLVKEDLQKKLFHPQGQRLQEFIEIECSAPDRFYLCAAVTKGEEVEISVVKHLRIGLDEKYDITERWFLKDLEMIDGKEADTVSCVFYCKFLIQCICYVFI
uniref:Exocyst complex component 1 like n=1 Tax=Pelodiscus sinensis TaxID=13735 RepID=K7FZ50_PELSI